ncbi:MAG: hypothetical protein JWR07_1168 [Nevskia sp.]|nr:hypothetical protein [Nevskia sp.]
MLLGDVKGARSVGNYLIYSNGSGANLGDCDAPSADAALDLWAQKDGFKNYAEACASNSTYKWIACVPRGSAIPTQAGGGEVWETNLKTRAARIVELSSRSLLGHLWAWVKGGDEYTEDVMSKFKDATGAFFMKVSGWAALLTFIGAWLYAISVGGFVLGVGLGWLPALICAAVAYFMWYAVVVCVVLVFVFKALHISSCVLC